MQQNRPTLEHLRTLLSYDAKTGALTWIVPPSNRIKPGYTAGALTESGRIVVGVAGLQIPAQHIAWLFSRGEWPYGKVKFRNRDYQDLRADNLYDADEDLKNDYKSITARERMHRYRYALAKDARAERASVESAVKGVKYNSATDSYDVYVLRGLAADLGGRDVLTVPNLTRGMAERTAREIDANMKWLDNHPGPVLTAEEGQRRAGPSGVLLERLHRAVAYNGSTGAFIWRETLLQRGVRADHKNTAGTRVVQMAARAYPAKLLAWFMTYREWPGRKSLVYRDPPVTGRDDENRLSNLARRTTE